MPNMKPYIDAIESLPADVDQATREATAARLALCNYSPLLSVDAPDFLHYTKDTLKQRCIQISESDSDASTAADDNTTVTDIELLVNQYKLLQRLRQDDPEAWDLIEELYGED